jgi:hypothetical protein
MALKSFIEHAPGSVVLHVSKSFLNKGKEISEIDKALCAHHKKSSFEQVVLSFR